MYKRIQASIVCAIIWKKSRNWRVAVDIIIAHGDMG